MAQRTEPLWKLIENPEVENWWCEAEGCPNEVNNESMTDGTAIYEFTGDDSNYIEKAGSFLCKDCYERIVDGPTPQQEAT